MTMYQPEPNEDTRRAVASVLHENWVLFLVEGIVLVLLGAAAIILPVIATLAFTLLIGWLFLLSGVVGLVTTFWMRNAPGFWWSLLSAVIGIAAGIVLIPLADQRHGVTHAGADRIFHHRGHRHADVRLRASRAVVRSMGLDAASGIVDLILAGIIFAGLPETATWALGLLVGINLLFGGTAMIGMALAARNAA